MKKIAISSLVAMGAIALPAAAQAQSNDSPQVEPYVGASVGLHDLGLGFDGDDGGIYGVVAGVDVPVGERFFVGAEGNFHFGDGAIDKEYGAAARAGIRVGENGKLFVRGGYQEVDLDVATILGGNPPPGVDVSDGDFIVGAGVEFGVGDGPIRLRAGVDSVAFDTTRATVGVLFGF